MRQGPLRAAVLAAALAAAASCSPAGHPGEAAETSASSGVDDARDSRAPRSMPQVIFDPGAGDSAAVDVEIAKTPAAIERGLMYREHLPPDRGMLFIFEDERLRSFWMKNTLIPLDMIFISSEREVVGVVERAEPQTTTPRRIDEPARYVVEVNGGWAEAHGIGAGARVRFVGVD